MKIQKGLMASIVSVLMLTGISSAYAGVEPDPISIEFQGCEGIDPITCSWKATGTDEDTMGASHVVFGIESCLDFIVGFSPDETDPRIDSVEFGLDPTTGITGIKWNYDFDFKNSTDMVVHTVELSGTGVMIKDIEAAIKFGGNVSFLEIEGPMCDGIPPVPPESVAGEVMPLDNTALFLAGLTSSAIWIVPTVASLVAVTGTLLYRSRRA